MEVYMKLKFTKMHGCGNDYIYVDCTKEPLKNPEKISSIISHRNYGIGSDGLILIYPSEVADFKMIMFNADGSEGAMCGNGIRCVAKYVYDNMLTSKTNLIIETKSGIRRIRIITQNGVSKIIEVNMGFAVFEASAIPVITDSKSFINQEISVHNIIYKCTAVSVGNPHLVIFTDSLREIDLGKIGPVFEKNPIFPNNINTEFVKIISPRLLEMRVWERGSGETLACGTGACASVAAAVKLGMCKHGDEITVKLLGGELKIVYRQDNSILMRGTAHFIFDGEIDVNI